MCALDRSFWGDGNCDLTFNNPEHKFDAGDCCLQGVTCKLEHSIFELREIIECPENPCIRSNVYCIPHELGDGICQDHNNGPLCDFDHGDCCLVNRFEVSECWPCSCQSGQKDPFNTLII